MNRAIGGRSAPARPASSTEQSRCSPVAALFLPNFLADLAHVGYSNERLSERLVIGGGLVVVANVLCSCPSAATFEGVGSRDDRAWRGQRFAEGKRFLGVIATGMC